MLKIFFDYSNGLNGAVQKGCILSFKKKFNFRTVLLKNVLVKIQFNGSLTSY